jgi:hypothetical protein
MRLLTIQISQMKSRFAFTILSLSVLLAFAACTSSDGDPKAVAKNFYEALEKKNWDEAAKYTTKDSKTAIELVKSVAEMGKAVGGDPVAQEEEITKQSNVVYGKAIINGDIATVPITVNGETNDIKLKKEDGVWKVAFDKNTIMQTAADKSGKSIDEINMEMNRAGEELKNINTDSLKAELEKLEDVMKNDTLRKALDKAGDALKKVGEAMKDASKEKQ